MGNFFVLVPEPPKKKIFHENGEDFIEVATSVRRRDFYQFIGDAQDLTRRADQLVFSTEKLFELFVRGWSLVDEQGSPVPATIDKYNQLSFEQGRWVDEKLQEHLQTIVGPQVREDEGKSEPSAETLD